MTGPRWLLSRRRRPEAPARLYCFPHSGGQPGEYMRWSDGLPGVEVWGVQLPGRGSRSAEPPKKTMAELIAALVGEVELAPPYAFFGHSLGALVAYETALALRDLGRPGPDHLFLSAVPAPHLHVAEPGAEEVGDPELVAAVERQFGPLPAAVHEDPELRRLAMGTLRADLAIVAAYRAAPVTPVDCSIFVLGGDKDDEASEEQLAAWRPYTTGPFSLRLFPGGHFYFREHHDDVLHLLRTALAGHFG
jgi:surfactin synthase thioesterase subunit